MWKSILSAVVIIVAVTLSVELFRNSSSALGQSNSALPDTTGLIVHTATAEDGGQHVIIVDPESRALAVYHVDGASGKVSLRSVRKVQWDLLIEEFNGVNPHPKDIRKLLN
ncbi:hypothetical protein DTL21_08475 [Bremerella cremea]|uniref:Uncharacterized protein n=1 Tax=Blastopirellula marina TaxID=124 RepID=A0A2S8FUX7_9BACT|nr:MULTISPECIES: hypothetical protein [Pirellulaceae]PQO35953.1 hypothetical protein C5Y83_08470 [Blastopirellula marina]RCS48630.1 hypothetical protein DTL21_08475 [Bremerella cremea]